MADRSVVYRLKADVTQFRAQMASAAASVQQAGDRMTGADRNGAQFREGLGKLGNVAGGVGLVAAAGLGAAVLKAADFDQAMSQVSAATHETAGNMDLLRAAALKAGADTAFSATEAAQGIEALSKAGVTTKDILAGGLTGALNLAAAGGQSVSDAAESAATAMTQFSLKGTDVGHIADLLAAGAGKAQGEVSDLSAALNQSGLVAAQMGLSIEDTTGTLAAFASAGLVGSDAGTAFKSMIQRLQNPIGQGATAMEKLGINAYDASGKFVGITEVAQQLQDKLGGLNQAQRDAAMAQIFGSDAVRAASVLYKQGATGIQGWIDKTNDSGYAAETAKLKMDNLKGDLEQLGGSLETALIGTGSGAQGPLRSLTQSLTGVINEYNRMGSGAKTASAATLGFVAVAGGSIFVFSRVVQSIAATRLAMTQLGVSSTRAVGAMRALAFAGGGLVALIAGAAAIRAIQRATDESLPGVQSLSKRLLDLKAGKVKDLGNEFDSLGESIARIGDKSTSESIVDKLQTPFTGLFGEAGSLRKARSEIGALDASLAALVSQGSPDVAAAALKSVGESSDLSASQMKQLTGLLPDYKEALAGVETQSMLASEAQGGLAGAAGQASGAMDANTAAAEANAEAQKAAQDAASATAKSFLTLGEGLNDSKVSLNDWIGQLSAQADALNNFTNNSVKAATRGLRGGLIKALQEAGPEGALRMRQLANATDKEIRAANRAWDKGQRAAAGYTSAVTRGTTTATGRIASMRGEIARIKGKIVHMDEKGAAAARARIAALRAEIARLHDRDVHINYIRRVMGVGPTGISQKKADGGYITGPGGPREDAIPAMLSNGEFVVNAAATRRNLALLHSINAQRFADGGLVRHFADGGEVGDGDRRGRGRGDNPRLKAFNAALARSTKIIEKETAARDAVVSKRNDFASSIRDNLRSDQFATSGSVWDQGGGSNVLGSLKSDIANANAMKALLVQLSRAGVKGDALASIDSLDKARAVTSLGAGGIQNYQALFNQRAALTTSVGAAGGAAAYGAQIAAMNTHLAQQVAHGKRLEHQIAVLTHEVKGHPEKAGKATGKAINGAARAGQRKKAHR